MKRLVEAGFDAPDPQSKQFAKLETYQLDRVDNLLKILQNVEGQETEISTQMTTASKKLNQYSRFDQWNLAYDANGNLSKRGGQDFTYDYRNRMVSASESGTTVSFNYDALGRRIEKAGPQGTTRYYYAGNQVIEERNAAGQVTRQYVYGTGIDEVLRLDVYTGGTAVPYYFHINQIGSTTAITDSDGNIVERITYDTYGRPHFSDSEGNSLNSSSIGNTTLFQGREYDPETGLYHYRARTYDPIMGRFLQVDPLGYVDSMNLYQAFNMNPVNYVDPLGLLIYNKEPLKLYPYYNRVDMQDKIREIRNKPDLKRTNAYLLGNFNIDFTVYKKSSGKFKCEFTIDFQPEIWYWENYKRRLRDISPSPDILITHEKSHLKDYEDLIEKKIIPFLNKFELLEFKSEDKLRNRISVVIRFIENEFKLRSIRSFIVRDLLGIDGV